MKEELAGVVHLPLESIEPSPFQVRSQERKEEDDKLLASIREQGLIHPILVRPHPDPEHYGQYELICGLRRFRAYQRLHEENPEQFSMIPARVRVLSDEEALLVLLEENELREDFTPYERALFFHKVYSSGKFESLRKMAHSFRVGLTTLHRYLRIFDLPRPMMEAFREGRLGLAQVEVLLEAPEELRKTLFHEFLQHPMSKEEARLVLRRLKGEGRDLLFRLRAHLGESETIRLLPRSQGVYELRLKFSDEQSLRKELARILHLLEETREGKKGRNDKPSSR